VTRRPLLDPAVQAVIEAMPAWRGADRLDAEPLEGGITNRNFLITVAGESFVARLPGEDTDVLGIDREHERRATEIAAAAGVGPDVVAYLADRSCLITRFIPGDPVPVAQMRTRETLTQAVKSIKGIHAAPPLPGTFSPFRVVETYAQRASDRGVDPPDDYAVLHAHAREIEAAFDRQPAPDISCHNDLLNANFLRRGDRIFIVDYEYAGMGDLFFDLGNLSINHEFDDDADALLLEIYFDGVSDSAAARLKLMRIMSDFREAMWGVLQQAVSKLDFDYVEYARKHFDRCSRHIADDRYESWLRAA
jgi:thiamine kinase-like enzyme